MKDLIIEYIKAEYSKQVWSNLFPNQNIQYTKSSESDIPDYIELRESNASFKDSDYFINPKDQTYIHFTSIDNYINICSTNEFRLYDLNFVDDPNEVLFAAINLGITDYYDYYKVKAAVNNLSFCTYPFQDEVIEHDLWRLYGRNGSGVGIIFSFQNDCLAWENYHLSKVYYNQVENTNKLKEALSKHNSFLTTLKEKFQIRDQKKLSFPDDLLIKLIAFHKNSIYKSENELRLIFVDPPRNKYSDKRVHTLNGHKKISNYTRLPLYDIEKGRNIELDVSFPSIKIYKILLGYRYEDKDKVELQSSLREIIVQNSKHYKTNVPEVEITKLKKYF